MDLPVSEAKQTINSKQLNKPDGFTGVTVLSDFCCLTTTATCYLLLINREYEAEYCACNDYSVSDIYTLFNMRMQI